MQNYFDNEATSSATSSSPTSSSSVHATMKPARGGKCLVQFSTYEVCVQHDVNHSFSYK